MLNTHVFKVRRDFSSVLVPIGCFTPRFRKKKRDKNRAYDDFGYCTSSHSRNCDCDCCASDKFDSLVPAVNSSDNGYVIRSRSKQAIRNAANSIFFRSEYKEYLRFVTFTFPPFPDQFETKSLEDKYLHNLFKKFLDNERKNYGLQRWLWVNERQSGDRLADHEKSAREVLHYHCIFEYENRINYYLVNLRFLRLLHRNGFNILSSYSQAVKKTSLHYPQLKKACLAIAKGDFNYLIANTERMYLRDNLGIKRFIFLSPVDFEKIRYESLDIQAVSRYITKYISKSSDKIYCRRWGSSQGLILTDDQLNGFMNEFAGEELVDPDTGEVISYLDQQKMLAFFTLGKEDAKVLKFTVNMGNKDEDVYYIPPNWQKWRHHSFLMRKFKQYFGYEL